MSNDENMNKDEMADDLPMPSRLDSLKNKARMLGITFSNNISEETLAARIEEHLAGKAGSEKSELNPLAGDEAGKPAGKTLTLRQRLIRDQMKLVRVRITNMDPSKKDLQGEIITVANDYIGTVRKFIPFGEATDDGYHIPQCLLTVLQERKYLQIRTVKDKRTGVPRPVYGWVREFAIEILDPLTQKDLDKLATAQLAAGTATFEGE